MVFVSLVGLTLLLCEVPVGTDPHGALSTGSALVLSPVAAPGTPVVTPLQQTAPADAGGRKGFIIGVGGGVGFARTELPAFRIGSVTIGGGTEHSVGVATDFKIGYAPTDHVLVYYTNSALFADGGPYDLLALTGGGVTYIHGRRAPSWFVHGAGGAGTGARFDFDDGGVESADVGSAFSAGGGFEFARRWFVDGSVLLLSFEGRRHTIVKGTINWIFY